MSKIKYTIKDRLDNKDRKDSFHAPLSGPLVKVNSTLKSDRVNLVAPVSPIECLLYLPNVRAIQYKLC